MVRSVAFIAFLFVNPNCWAAERNDLGEIPVGADGRPLNMGFETGDLRDWTATGDAFFHQPVEGNTVALRRGDMQSNHAGRFWVGTYERVGDPGKGTLTSKPFKVTRPYASFLVGGGRFPETRVEVVRKDTGNVVFKASGEDREDMQRVVVDLTDHQGKEIFVRVVDQTTVPWGHVNFDDFRFHAQRPAFAQRKIIKTDVHQHSGLSPEEAAKAMTVPPGFSVKLFAGEPDVRQPIAMAIDDRGRIWVIENYTYPRRAPEGKGKDRIVIFEDVDGDGHFDKRTVFCEGLNMASGLELGFGGVFVGAVPYLMFIPLDEKTDKPAGPPQILLDGWGYDDTHEVLNSFIWGPDGWLYGCHGVFTHSKVGKPGTPAKDRTPLNAGVWRYHPVKHMFEVFAQGTSNPWGLDFNENGDAFITACVIPHLFHVFEGGRFFRQAGSHFNPYTYDDIKTIAKHSHWSGANPWAGNGVSSDLGGGHAHAGCMIYQGGTWPKEYHGKLFMNNIHGARLNVDQITPQGSGYVGDRNPDFLFANDSWSQIINIQYGPDGNVYFIDWYDRQQCHTNRPEDHDRTNGRIFKIVWEGKPSAAAIKYKDGSQDSRRPWPNGVVQRGSDLKKSSFIALMDLMGHPNQYFVRHARRIVQERFAVGNFGEDVIPRSDREKVETILGTFGIAPLIGPRIDLTEKIAAEVGCTVVAAVSEDALVDEHHLLNYRSPKHGKPLSLDDRFSLSARLTSGLDSPAKVRLLIASRIQKESPETRFQYLPKLIANAEDASDHNLPLMYWYAAEPLGAVDPTRALDLVCNGKIPMLVNFMSRRIAAIGTPEAFAVLVDGLKKYSKPAKQLDILLGMNFSLQGQRQATMPAGWIDAYQLLAKSPDANVRREATTLAVKFGDSAAFASMRELIIDKGADVDRRRAALSTLLNAKDKELAPTLQRLISDPALRRLALQGLGAYNDPGSAQAILAGWRSFALDEKRDALNALASRESYASALLHAIGDGRIASAEVSADVIRQLRNLQSKTIDKQIGKVWGVARESTADKAKEIAKYRALLTRKPRQKPDVSLGRAVFAKNCQQCHTLFGVGNTTAPDLTGSNRANLEYFLANVVDPNAVIGKDYLAHRIQLSDGRVLTAIIRKQDEKSITAVTANEILVIPRSEIELMKVSNQSLMPENLLTNLPEHDLRSLVAYLANPTQAPLPAGFQLPGKQP